MRLTEAIAHAKKQADQMTILCENDKKCAKEHLQLAQWLEELRKLRKQCGIKLDGV